MHFFPLRLLRLGLSESWYLRFLLRNLRFLLNSRFDYLFFLLFPLDQIWLRRHWLYLWVNEWSNFTLFNYFLDFFLLFSLFLEFSLQSFLSLFLQYVILFLLRFKFLLGLGYFLVKHRNVIVNWLFFSLLLLLLLEDDFHVGLVVFLIDLHGLLNDVYLL